MEKVEKFLKINFNSEPIYGDNDKYIKIYASTICGSVNMPKECQKKNQYASFCQ